MRGALLGLTLTNPDRGKRTATVMVDAHSELMTQYPWGFDNTVPNAKDNAADTGSVDRGTLVFRDTGRLPGEAADHSYTAIVGSDRRADGRRDRTRALRALRRRTRLPRRAEGSDAVACDDGPFGKGTGGQLRYRVELKGRESKTLWIAVAGSERSPGEARDAFAKLTRKPDRLLAAKRASRKALDRWSRVDLPGDRSLQDSIEWGKQNLADLTQTAKDLDIRWTNEGTQWTHEGDVPEVTWVGAGFPDYPWLFATDGQYTAHASVTLGQFEAIKDHMRALRDVSDVLNDGSGVVVHEMVGDGSVWHGKGTTTAGKPDFNTDEIVKLPGAVALIWRWTGDDRFRDEMLDFTRRNLAYVREHLDTDGDGWPEGNGNVERDGMGPEKLDNAVYYIRGLYDYADMARSAGQTAAADAAEARADDLRGRFDPTWWIDGRGRVRRLAGRAGQQAAQPEALDRRRTRWRPSCIVDGETVPGIAPFEHGTAGARRRARTAATAASAPATAGCSTPAAAAARTGAGEFAIFSLGTAVMAVGEGNYGRLGADRQQRYTGANAETQFSEPATGGTPDEQPGAMPEIFPSYNPDTGAVVNPPNIDRCWTCRSMFMQSWGHYGTAWAVVHQQLGVRPQLGHDRLDVVPQVPDGQPRVQGSDIRLGRGSADVLAAHDGDRYTTVTDTHRLALREFRIGHTLPRGSTVESVVLDGRAVDHDAVETNRGVEVSVEAAPGRRHTLVVTAG